VNIIEQTKHDGAVHGLSRRIYSLLSDLKDRNWDNIIENGTYCRLGEAINDAENILEQLRETLAALQELEPENK
jgi:hypothetical protein